MEKETTLQEIDFIEVEDIRYYRNKLLHKLVVRVAR
jgi:hypothetical protein